MGEILIAVLKWSIRIAFVLSGIFAFIIILNLSISLIFVTLNQSVLGDLFAIIQLWLPFNLNVLLAWLLAASTAYISYKLAVMSISWVNRVIGKM